jgi:hypothetical protein
MLLGIIIAGTGRLCLSEALRFPQAVREASSALKRLRGLPCPVLLQESRAFRTNQQVQNQHFPLTQQKKAMPPQVMIIRPESSLPSLLYS